MKKSYLFYAVGAMMLASCANDGVVNNAPIDNETTDVAMKFNITAANQGRATNLQTEFFDFGVWAYKGADQTVLAADGNLVMKDYLVGHYHNEGTDEWGYKPTAGQDLFGTEWYYEGLGKNDNGFTFVTGGIQAAANASLQNNQFLKYWDLTPSLRTFFYAAAPYTATAGVDAFNPATRTLTFAPMEMAIDPTDVNDAGNLTNVMYATANYLNTDMATGNKVNLTFNRLGAKIRLAFYEEIPGYKVEIIGYSEGNPHIYALPSIPGTPTYTTGSYTYKGQPKVVFDGTTGNVEWDNYDRTSNALISPLWMTLNGVRTVEVGPDRSHCLLTEFKGVLPANTAVGKENTGFTLNVSFRLIAEDTDEVIYVRGARVYVDPMFTAWEPNTQYTYIFKISKGIHGQATDPGDPQPTPNSDQALWPIIFDQCTIQPITDVAFGDFGL